MLHPIDLVKQLLQGRGDLPFDLLSAQAGSRYEHVGQGNDNLGLLLTRCDHQGNRPAHQGDKQDDQGQRPLHCQRKEP